MSPWWEGFTFGVLLLPGMAVGFVVLVVVLSPPSWDTQWCVAGCDLVQRREDHPWWPRWVWAIRRKAHNWRYRHGPQIRAWQAEHTVKPHWWSRRRVVR